ncbi:helix-turn-helix transcriptional regulator [Cohnella fermenti]|uniref:AraC family transcriptional regulator n=1 Tax=Cohnella fermenti TaxID=2565925 RepID=A0A4S4BS15_9BACL|nr:AraC family transcriptional regulator [Cohnella fermenti]THF77816.1 AraC family transcriptional regulator [Cohnella fermenti]
MPSFVDRETPERLLHERYMLLNTPFRLFMHRIAGLIPVHWHEFFEIALVTSGTGTHRFNGRSLPLKRGSLFLLTPADFHELVNDDGCVVHLYNAIFVQEFIRAELLQWIYQAGEGIAVELEEDITLMLEREFERVWEESERPRQGSGWIVAGALERILVELMRRHEDGKGRDHAAHVPAIHPSISKAITYLSFRFHENLTLETVSRHVGLSANYFSERFRKETGVTFQRFLQEQRLKFAFSLLSMSQLPITEVCYASGFGNLSHFERAFKHKYGRTPRQIRSSGA